VDKKVSDLATSVAKAMQNDSAATMAAINAGKKPYFDRTRPDVYAFIDDMDMTVVAHKTEATRGTSLKGRPDITGKLWRDYILAEATAGKSGWMEYVYQNADGTGYLNKACYYTPVTGSDGVKYIACATHDVGPYEPPTQTPAQNELKAFVAEAQEYAASHDRDAAIKEFMSTTGTFYRDGGRLYIFAYDMKGTVLCLPAEPAKVGEARWDYADPSGGFFVRGFVYVAQSDAGAGWVSYRYPDPAKNMEVQNKHSYVVKIDDEWLIGAGYYTTD
jgi:polar amino acid transport system substrate-binding protein